MNNPTGNLITAFASGKQIIIPSSSGGGNSVIVNFPDESAERWMRCIKKMYPAVSLDPMIDSVADVVDPVEQEKGISTLEEFTAKAIAERGRGGWWTVEVEGLNECLKVQGCDDEDAAILEAYEKYTEENEG